MRFENWFCLLFSLSHLVLSAVAEPPVIYENVAVDIYNINTFETAKNVCVYEKPQRLLLVIVAKDADSNVFLTTAQNRELRQYLNDRFVVAVLPPSAAFALWAGVGDDQVPTAIVYMPTDESNVRKPDHSLRKFAWPVSGEDLLTTLKRLPVPVPPKPEPLPEPSRKSPRREP